jgi:hypothetical protein
MAERRQHVRAKPSSALPAHVINEVSGITERLDVVDISVGGMALLQGLVSPSVTSKVLLQLVLPSGTYSVDGIVRWAAKGVFGVEFVGPPEETSKAIQRFIGELLERGA